MTEIVAILPVPPSANGLFRNLPRGGRAKTRAYETWLSEAGPIIFSAWHDAGRPTMAPPLRFVLETSAGRQRDVSNMIKPVEDAFVASIPALPDDRWNDEVIAVRRDRGDERIIIATLSSMGPPG